MRNKTENAALLKSIRRDLRGWEEGVRNDALDTPLNSVSACRNDK